MTRYKKQMECSMIKYMLFACIALICFIGVDCKEEPPIVPPDSTAGFSFNVEDTTCTEVFLRLKFNIPNLVRTVSIRRDSLTLFTKTIISNDTLLVDENLQPNHFYNYTAIITDKSEQRKVSTTTMDTTSHDWTWELQSFGDGSSSAFYDAAIVNDTLAYAVGEIYKKDSTGKFEEQVYNLAKWNGKTWSLHRLVTDLRILNPGSGGDSLFTLIGHSIFAFGENNIWIAAGNVFHFNGTEWTQQRGELAGYSNKIWGGNASNIYFVGNNGTIIHYDGKVWQKLKSGTSLNFYDVWGSQDVKATNSEILTVGSSVGTTLGSVIISINGKNVSQISTGGVQGNLTTLWFISNRVYFLGSHKLYTKYRLTESLWNFKGITSYAPTSINGNNLNDLFVSATYGDVIHFNGLSWKSFYEDTQLANGVYGRIICKNNFVIAVGYLGSRGVITMGKRL